MVKPIIWLLAKKEKGCYAIDVAAIRINEGKLPHFGLIFSSSTKEAEELYNKRGILPIAFLLGKHWDAQKWDFVENNGMAMLLIPKRYVFFSIIVFSYFVRLAPKEIANAAKA